MHVVDGRLDRGFQGRVLPPRVVVERHQVLHSREPGEGQRIVDRTVPLADVARILLARVRRVVEQQVDPADQVQARGPLRGRETLLAWGTIPSS
jgi:hypothetical protein